MVQPFCTRKDDRMSGLKMQVVEPVNLATLEVEGKPVVAIDAVGAGYGEIVFDCWRGVLLVRRKRQRIVQLMPRSWQLLII